MAPLNVHDVAFTIRGLHGVGPGIASGTAWIVATVMVLLLASIAWWTMKPAKRDTRADLKGSRAANPMGAEQQPPGHDKHANNDIRRQAPRSRS